MNESTQQSLKNRKRRIEQRLDHERVWAPQDDPMFTGTNVHYEMSERTRGIDVGGLPAMHLLAKNTGLAKEIDARVHLLKVHLPYHESDHVLNIALNVCSGGTCLEDLELRRNNESYLDALGAQRIPDPTTAGDFCRRFTAPDVEALMVAINETRLRVWQQQPDEFFAEAIVEADGTHAITNGECKQGMDITYGGEWGYHPLVVSLANTGEPLFLVNRGGNRPSQEGAAERFDQSLVLLRRAGFRKILFRGDTDFSQAAHLDRWAEEGVQFVFGYDAKKNLIELADSLPATAFQPMRRPAKYEVKTEPRERPDNVKESIVQARGYLNQHLLCEEVAEFDYRPTACKKTYRMIVLKKNLSIERGESVLFADIRYFFYITNRQDLTPEQVVQAANKRCNQENLIAQLKSGVRAMRMPVDTLVSNWAYMVMAALAWNMKAWFALLLPVEGRWHERYEQERDDLLHMEFRTFLNAIIRIPAQVVRTGRKIVLRLMSWTRWLPAFFRGIDALRVRLC